MVAETFQTDHYDLTLGPDALGRLEDLAWHLDEPFGDSSAIPTYMVSKLAAERVKVVLSGDGRLLEHLRHEDLVPLGTRIRTRLNTESASREELSELLSHALAKAGNGTLMTAELRDTLVDHAAGNCRLLMNMAGELLVQGMAHEVGQFDEKRTTGDDAARLLHEPATSLDGAAGRQQVVDHQDLVAGRDGIGVDFQGVGAVLQIVAQRLGVEGELARFADGD